MTIAVFIVVLVILILVHEWGHFIVAKKSGIRVDEFGIGFPPKVFGKKVGETEYTINLLPIGGFVRIWGEDPTIEHDETVPDSERSFVRKSRWLQAAVLVAGVAMNVVLAFVLYVAAYMIGMPVALDADASPAELEQARLLVTAVLPEAPAAGNLAPGDEILNVHRGDDVVPVEAYGLAVSTVAAFIGEVADEQVTLDVRRGGETMAVTITPTTGVVAEDSDRVAAGFSMAHVGMERRPLVAAIGAAAVHTVESTVGIATGLWSLVVGAVRGTADLSQVAGPVGIVTMVGDAMALGFTWLLMFSAFISLNLAVLNILPIPALDGGRLLFVAIEGITRRRIKPIVATRINQLGFIALLLLMALVTIHDVFKLVG